MKNILLFIPSDSSNPLSTVWRQSFLSQKFSALKVCCFFFSSRSLFLLQEKSKHFDGRFFSHPCALDVVAERLGTSTSAPSHWIEFNISCMSTYPPSELKETVGERKQPVFWGFPNTFPQWPSHNFIPLYLANFIMPSSGVLRRTML